MAECSLEIERNTMPRTNELALLGDIGATNARLGRLQNGALGPVEWMAAAQFARFAPPVSRGTESILSAAARRTLLA